MRYAKKSPEELQVLRHTLVNRLVSEQPDVAQAARWIREAIGLNQKAFAALVGLSTPQIARLERGEANPTLDTLQAVGKPFGLKIGFVHPDTRGALLEPELPEGAPISPIPGHRSLQSTPVAKSPAKQAPIPPLKFK